MGFRFRKRIRLAKGFWINVSKKGASLSVGGHGLTTNIGNDGVRETVGLPGTGISYQTKRIKPGSRPTNRPTAARKPVEPTHILKAIIIVIALLMFWVLLHMR
jgi:Protein of unknown function (DUF4236)